MTCWLGSDVLAKIAAGRVVARRRDDPFVFGLAKK
jgi:hypothetical protein